MKIRLLSDTHFEFYEDKQLFKNYGEDVLVVAGDLDVGHQRVWSALKRFGDIIPEVVYVPGNHEYYGSSMEEFDDYVRRFSYGTNIHFLNPGSITLFAHTRDAEPITFIGATLWTNFGEDRIARLACASRINDFNRIKSFDTNKCVDTYIRHSKFIRESYSKLPGKKVVVTHFLPDRVCIAPEYQGPDLINNYFANNLGNEIADMKDTTWLFGHTHSNVDVTIGTTRCIANPYGYNKNPNYTEYFIEV